MPVATNKTTKTTKTAKTDKAVKNSTTSPKTTRPTADRTSSEVEGLRAEVKSLTSDIVALEAKVSTLIKVLHTEMKRSMRSGPEGVAAAIGRAGLLD